MCNQFIQHEVINPRQLRDIPLLQLTNLPTLESFCLPELTPELKSSPRTGEPLICSGIDYLSFCSPKPISNSVSIISGCFSSYLPRLPILGIVKATFCFSHLCTSSQLLSTSLGKVYFPQNLIWK